MTILITGAGSGIGAACARHFGERGWTVCGLTRRDGDLATEAGIAAAARACPDRLQAVIHAAGDFLAAPIEQTPPPEFERIWRITVWAKHALTRALLPRLAGGADEPARAIVHVASLAAHRDFPEETAYISAMHGVVGLARAQDAELRGRGIRACVLSPGLVRTRLTERSFPPEALAGALAPAALAASAGYLVETVRAGGYIPEIFHAPQNST